jgi:hypothetical protein
MTPYEVDSMLPADPKFHQDTWVDILKHAKELFLLWFVTQEDPWPRRETHLVNADICLTAAIETYREKGNNIEKGRT